MLVTTVISLPERIISFGQVYWEPVVVMARKIEEWWIVVFQWFIVERLEFMVRVVREESNFLFTISSAGCKFWICTYSWFLDSCVCSSELLYRLNKESLHGSCLQRPWFHRRDAGCFKGDADQRALCMIHYPRSRLVLPVAQLCRVLNMLLFSTRFQVITYQIIWQFLNVSNCNQKKFEKYAFISE